MQQAIQAFQMTLKNTGTQATQKSVHIILCKADMEKTALAKP